MTPGASSIYIASKSVKPYVVVGLAVSLKNSYGFRDAYGCEISCDLFIYVYIYFQTYLFIYEFIYSIYSFIHLFMHSFIYAFNYHLFSKVFYLFTLLI